MPDDLTDEEMAEGVDTLYLRQRKETSSNVTTIVPISLISHLDTTMLRVILNRLEAKAEELLAEGQASFRPGRSTVEHIFNSRVTIKKHLQHQRDLFRNLIDFKKAFDRLWHAGLWQVLRSFSIEEGLVQVIQALNENSSSAVFLNSQPEEFVKTTVGVRQGCLLLPILLNLFLNKIMQETLYDHYTSISFGERFIRSQRFADDIDHIRGSNSELQDLTNRHVNRATRYKMEVSTKRSKIATNSTNNISTDIRMKGQK